MQLKQKLRRKRRAAEIAAEILSKLNDDTPAIELREQAIRIAALAIKTILELEEMNELSSIRPIS